MFMYQGRRYFLNGDMSGVRVADESGNWITDPLTDDDLKAARFAMIAGGRASAYLEGRQDAGESDRDTDIAIKFGEAYAVHVYRYRTERHYSMTNIQHAYDQWRSGAVDPAKWS